MLFSMERREQIVKDKPELRSNVTEMSKIIGKLIILNKNKM
jgi:hypothetical protein